MSSGIQSNFVAAVTRFDTAVVTFVGARRQRPVARLMLALTHAGDTESWFLQGLLLSLIHPMPGTVFAHIAVAALAASGVAQLLKRSWKRPRPSAAVPGFLPACQVPDCFSFPSGHSCVAFAVASALQGFGALGTFELALACGVGSSRVYLGAHYPLDVVVGASVGWMVGAATRVLLAP